MQKFYPEILHYFRAAEWDSMEETKDLQHVASLKTPGNVHKSNHNPPAVIVTHNNPSFPAPPPLTLRHACQCSNTFWAN